MKNTIKYISVLLSLVTVLLLFLACGEVPRNIGNDTRETQPKIEDKALPPIPEGPEFYIENKEFFYPSSHYWDYVNNIDNKIYVFRQKQQFDEWKDTDGMRLSLIIKPYNWFDISPRYDMKYQQLLSQYNEAYGYAQERAKKYSLNKSDSNKEKYYEAIETISVRISAVNEYVTNNEKTKMNALKTHFESIGEIGTVFGDELHIQMTYEQLLTLLDTDFLFFTVKERYIEQPFDDA